VLAAAFRNLHGPRLHGFAMLVTLGDQQAAERVAGFSLAAGAEQAAALRHPERAAAWLRARTLRALRSRRWLRGSTPIEVRRAALAPLGVGEAVYRGLAALSIDARAALVASDIERFDPIDVETILDAAPAATRHTVARARNRYLQSASDGASEEADWAPYEPAGELAGRVQAVAARAFSSEAPR
jgi:DNA-directed RNA polymerase specialized sigma24 family protein